MQHKRAGNPAKLGFSAVDHVKSDRRLGLDQAWEPMNKNTAPLAFRGCLD